MTAVEVCGVRKAFRRHRGLREMLRRSEFDTALAGIDFDVEEGDIFGLLGPNGAGKTTLIKILCGLITPDAGKVRISGFDTSSGADARRSLGVVYGDERSFHWRLSVRENLRFFARLYKLDTRAANRRIEELLELVGLSYAGDRRMLGFSSGMKQRAAIARGLLHDPKVVLMDEPTRMLDPIGSHDVHRLIREQVAADGRTVIIATNLMTEAESLCSRLLLMDRGTAILTGTIDDLRAAYQPETVYRFVVEGTFVISAEALLDVPGVLHASVEPRSHQVAEMVVVFDGATAGLPALIRMLVDRELQITSCLRQEATLEEVFRAVVGARTERIAAWGP